MACQLYHIMVQERLQLYRNYIHYWLGNSIVKVLASCKSLSTEILDKFWLRYLNNIFSYLSKLYNKQVKNRHLLFFLNIFEVISWYYLQWNYPTFITHFKVTKISTRKHFQSTSMLQGFLHLHFLHRVTRNYELQDTDARIQILMCKLTL